MCSIRPSICEKIHFSTLESIFLEDGFLNLLCLYMKKSSESSEKFPELNLIFLHSGGIYNICKLTMEGIVVEKAFKKIYR